MKNIFTASGIIFITGGLGLLCFLLWFFLPQIQDEFVAFRRKQDLQKIEEQLNIIINNLPESASDDLIRAEVIQPLTVGKGLLSGCIKASYGFMYGTTREFNYVLDEYEALVENSMIWEQNNRNSYISEYARFQLYLYESTDSNYPKECSEFHVCYSVQLYFADPSVDSCSG